MIKTKIIKTDEAEILVIGGLPEDVVKIIIENEHLWLRCEDDAKDNWGPWGNLPPGKWQPLGFLKDVTENVAKELVPQSIPHHTTKKPIWEDYTYYTNHPITNNRVFNTATESLHSLVAANCKLENTLGEWDDFDKQIYNHSNERLQEWKSEQEKVFTNPYLLKKIK